MTTIPPPAPEPDSAPPASSGDLPQALLEGFDGSLASLQVLFALAVTAVVAAGFFATLRSALERAHPDRVLAGVPEGRQARLRRQLQQADRLGVSAAMLKVLCDLSFVAAVAGIASQLSGGEASLTGLLIAFAVAAPLLLLVTEALPTAVARERGEGLLRRTLSIFYVAQLPLSGVVMAVDAVRRALLRMLKLREGSPSARKIVEGLREVIEGASIEDLDPTEREIIENLMEFRDVDVSAIMTPRTELHAVDVSSGLRGALKVVAECGHSRIPVYDVSIDTIIGTVTALQLVRLVAAEELDTANLRDVLNPPFLVPESKSISDLLVEFRRNRHKIAVVVDEYGGTAGMVTVYDVVAEIVGDIADENGAEDPPVRELESNLFEVEAGAHVSEVNEALGLDLPEEADFETLGGFVLSELGRFPKEGETFRHGATEFGILQASDRRVYKVLVRRGA